MTYFCSDAHLDLIKNLKIGIIGFGSQGSAQAFNLRDSGLNIEIGLPKNSKSIEIAKKLGFKVADSIEDLTKSSDIIVFLFPDELHASTYKESIESSLSKGKSLIFAHGFSIFYKQIPYPEWVNIGMISPKAIGPALRKAYQKDEGVPALIAIENNYSKENDFKNILLAYAKALGCTRSGVFETSFKEECEADLFGEQAAICGALTALIQSAYETLVESNYRKEIAYFECIHELKFIVDLIYKEGLTHTYSKISNTAKYGALSYIPSFKEKLKPLMQDILNSIQNKQFAKNWILESENNQKNLKKNIENIIQKHPLEKLSDNLRHSIFKNPGKKE